ncbi:MAG: hypothetical protein MJB57_09920 [Gemmatimonadetes bacterium]|nr:hypothetical protein [Gemmatimonadota bacterium]
MNRSPVRWGCLAAVALACGGPVPPGPGGDLTFAVLGDAPSHWFEDRRFDRLIEALNRDSLDWVVHVGDMFAWACSDAKMRDRVERFSTIVHPVVYTPGDNEWTDCWEAARGGYAPLERLEALRGIMYARPGSSLGGRTLRVEHQASDEAWPEFVENQRWVAKRILFVTVHVVGSFNGSRRHEGRTAADDEDLARRTSAAVTWIREAFERAKRDTALAVFLAMHGDPELGERSDEDAYEVYDPIVRAIEEGASSFSGKVVLMHGDSHPYRVDRPVRDRRTGEVLENLTRLIVMGSPAVGWVRVVVDTAGPSVSFTPNQIPGWKLW